jgi:protein-disulfide isomerase
LECAPTEADFAQLLDLLYAKQDSLGLKAWTAYAADAGIVDTAAFARCTADTARVEAIEVGVALGERLGVHLTPTILLNGWRYHGGMPQAQLDAVIKRLLAGKNPS